MEHGFDLQFIGSGDAFGSGGRLQACFLLRSPTESVMVDCGCSSLIGLKRAGIAPSSIRYVLVSHLHGDHFGGLPFLVLDGQFSGRSDPLVVVGPQGTRQRVQAAMELFFPGSVSSRRKFELSFIELDERVPYWIGAVEVTGFPVNHPCGAPPLALRVRFRDRVFAYSGDTAWTDELVEVAHGANVFVCEAYYYEKKVPFHLDYMTLMSHRERLQCDRIVVTHMSEDVLSRREELALESAYDGLTLSVR